MASSIELFIQFIKEHPGATKHDIAAALGFKPAWVNKELYNEAKKPNSNLYKDDSTLPKWYYRTNIKEKNPLGTLKFVHDEQTLRVRI